MTAARCASVRGPARVAQPFLPIAGKLHELNVTDVSLQVVSQRLQTIVLRRRNEQGNDRFAIHDRRSILGLRPAGFEPPIAYQQQHGVRALHRRIQLVLPVQPRGDAGVLVAVEKDVVVALRLKPLAQTGRRVRIVR